MSETKRFKANKLLEGHPCGTCTLPLVFGEEVVKCGACGTADHAGCWDEKGGCSTTNCENAPLKRLTEQTEEPEAPPGEKRCPHCGTMLSLEAQVCYSCNQICTPDGVYRGPKQNAEGAVSSVVYGILGLFICGPIFGYLAIKRGGDALKTIQRDPTKSGAGLAQAGRVMGFVDIAVWGLFLLLRVAGGPM